MAEYRAQVRAQIKAAFSQITLPQLKAEVWVMISEILIFFGGWLKTRFQTGRLNAIGGLLEGLGIALADDQAIKREEIGRIMILLMAVIWSK